MNNEPVAWGWYDLEIKRFFPHWDENLMENKEGCIPLYTHPAKTITEIIEKNKPEIEKANAYIKLLEDEIAILRKAQEK